MIPPLLRAALHLLHVFFDLFFCYLPLCQQEGGFYSAEDAESLPQLGDAKQKEGAFCCWRHEEIKQLLPQVVEGTCMAGRCISFWEVFCHHYCIQPEGNVPGEPGTHGDLKGQNVLKVGGTVEETSQHFNIAVNLVDAVLDHGKRVLLESRRLRPRPHRDDKIVTAWNGKKHPVLLPDDCHQHETPSCNKCLEPIL